VTVVLDDIVKLLGKSGGFFVCQIKMHGPDMGSRLAVAKAGRFRALMILERLLAPGLKAAAQSLLRPERVVAALPWRAPNRSG
jgi:hypothetical protein